MGDTYAAAAALGAFTASSPAMQGKHIFFCGESARQALVMTMAEDPPRSGRGVLFRNGRSPQPADCREGREAILRRRLHSWDVGAGHGRRAHLLRLTEQVQSGRRLGVKEGSSSGAVGVSGGGCMQVFGSCEC